MKVKTQLKNIASFSKGEQINGDDLLENGLYNYLNGGISPSGKWNSYNTPANTVTISEGGNSCGYVNYMKEPFWCGAHCYYLFNTLSNAKYLYYVLKSQQDRLMKIRSGACMPNIKKADLGSFEITYETDEKDQDRIVEILTKCEEIVASRKQQLQQLDELVKARFVEMFGDPETNPKCLKKVFLSDIAEYFNGLTYSPDNVTNDGTIVLRSSNIQNSQLNFADTVRVDSPIREVLYVKDNDILMCSRNGSARLVGKVALIKNISEPMTFGAFMMIIRSKYYPYLMTYFQMNAFRRQIATGATTTINQITGNMLNKTSLPIPEMADINVFADFVEQVDKSKFAVQKALDEAQTLFDSLMQEYFG